MNEKYKAFIMEYEKGWGNRVDEIREFDTIEERNAFITEYNSHNTEETVPDWYMVAVKG